MNCSQMIPVNISMVKPLLKKETKPEIKEIVKSSKKKKRKQKPCCVEPFELLTAILPTTTMTTYDDKQHFDLTCKDTEIVHDHQSTDTRIITHGLQVSIRTTSPSMEEAALVLMCEGSRFHQLPCHPAYPPTHPHTAWAFPWWPLIPISAAVSFASKLWYMTVSEAAVENSGVLNMLPAALGQ